MNALWSLGDIQWWHVAGWTMLHFLWIGTAALLLVGALRLLLRRASPAARYAAALSGLVMLTAMPVAIAAWLAAWPTPARDVVSPLMAADGDSDGATSAINRLDDQELGAAVTEFAAPTPLATLPVGAPAEVGEQSIADGERAEQPESGAGAVLLNLRAGEYLELAASMVPWLWIVGTPLTFLLLATGIVGAERLRRTSRLLDDGPIVEACGRLVAAMHIGRRVAVAVCDRIAAPVLVGIVRPIILLPPSALTGWTPDEIEMVLLHELAHVRRWDNLVNLLQRMIEALLFFHPAVWLVSSWVRREREACCDAVVVAGSHSPHAYAEMLVALAAQMPRSVLFHPSATSAMAAGPLRSRIRRILKMEDDPMLVSGRSLTLIVGALFVAATVSLLYVPNRGEAQESPPDASEPFDDGRIAEPVADNLFGGSSASREDDPFAQSQSADSPFPTLEEQKQADRAWKMLGLELEPIGKEDLARVKELGYDGGLVVTDASQAMRQNDAWSRGRDRGDYAGISRGDILIGLHVWPTTNLSDVGTVLVRDDLGELSPLKFYVVRREEPNADSERGTRFQRMMESSRRGEYGGRGGFGMEGYGGEMGGGEMMMGEAPPQMQDMVVTGRIEVMRSTGPAKSAAPASAAAAPTSATPSNPMSPATESPSSNLVPGVEIRERSTPEGVVYEAHPAPGSPPGAASNARYPQPAAAPPQDNEPPKPSARGGRGARTISPFGGSTKPAPESAESRTEGTFRPPQLFEPTQARRESPSKFTVFALKYLHPDAVQHACEELFANEGLRIVGAGNQLVVSGTPEQVERVSALIKMLDRPDEPARQEQQPTASGSALLELDLEAAKIKLQHARSEYERVAQLAKTGEVSTSEFDKAKAAMALAELEVRRAELRLKVGHESAWPLDRAPASKEMLELELEAAKINLKHAQTEYERIEQLAKTAAVPQAEVEAAKAKVQMAELEVRRAELRLKEAGSRAKTPEPQAAARPAGESDTTLRYNGRTFDEWRQQWRNELSPDKRAEAVHALAAFGASGMAEEATREIFAVAHQYDWHENANDPVKQACLAAFGVTGPVSYVIPPEVWLPILIDEINKDNPALMQMARYLVRVLGSDDGFAIDPMLKLLAVADESLGASIQHVLRRIDPNGEDPRIAAQWTELLSSQNPGEVTLAVEILGPRAFAMVDDPGALLLHPAPTVQQVTLRGLRDITNAGKEKLVNWALEVLKDEARKDDHVPAIRALAVLREPEKEAFEKLEQLMLDGEQAMPVRVAAATALERMTGDGRYPGRVWESYQEDFRGSQDSAAAREALVKLERAFNRERDVLP